MLALLALAAGASAINVATFIPYTSDDCTSGSLLTIDGTFAYPVDKCVLVEDEDSQWEMNTVNATHITTMYYTDDTCETVDDSEDTVVFESGVCYEVTELGLVGSVMATIEDVNESTKSTMSFFEGAEDCTGAKDSRSANGIKCISEDGVSIEIGSEGDGVMVFSTYLATGCEDADQITSVTVACGTCIPVEGDSFELKCSSAGSIVASLALVVAMLALLL